MIALYIIIIKRLLKLFVLTFRIKVLTRSVLVRVTLMQRRNILKACITLNVLLVATYGIVVLQELRQWNVTLVLVLSVLRRRIVHAFCVLEYRIVTLRQINNTLFLNPFLVFG